MPPSDEGGGFALAKPEGEKDKIIFYGTIFLYGISPSVSRCSTAPSSEGPEDIGKNVC